MSKPPNYTLRKGGERMTTLRAPVHVEELTVKRLATELGCNERTVLRKIAELLPSAINDMFAWRRFVAKDGKITMVHVDDISE